MTGAWLLANVGVSVACLLLGWFLHWSIGLAFWLLATLLLIVIRPEA